MPRLALPHTAGCIACGPKNPHGLHLSLYVDSESGEVTSDFVLNDSHIGFEGVIHGGVLATVLDEAMVWAAVWAGKRFCLCGELSIRFRAAATFGTPLSVVARVGSFRSRLIQTTGLVLDGSGAMICEATGKYVPLTPERNREVVPTLLDDPASSVARTALIEAAQAV